MPMTGIEASLTYDLIGLALKMIETYNVLLFLIDAVITVLDLTGCRYSDERRFF